MNAMFVYNPLIFSMTFSMNIILMEKKSIESTARIRFRAIFYSVGGKSIMQNKEHKIVDQN